MTLNGKKRGLRLKDFLFFADACQIDRTVARKMIDRLKDQEEDFLREIEESYLSGE